MSDPRERKGRPILLPALGGFVVGAATVLFIVWIYGGGRLQTSGPVPPPPPAIAPSSPPNPTAPAAPPTAGLPPAAPPPAAINGSPAAQQLPPATAPISAPSPVGGAGAGPPSPAAATADLLRRNLLLPVQGVRREDLRDTFTEARSIGRSHDAIDILAPRNSPVLAVEAGRVAKLFWSQRGGWTVYQFDPTNTYDYYYAHLERYAAGLKEGDAVGRGQVIGYVGTSGNAPPDTPHLHFAIEVLTADKHWWQGTAIDPYPILRNAAGAATPTR
ncbi:MAG TPA: M23 family metallopeptidase [Thermoanaerobaculia bacterium]|nr:M23 family metallopeptidase [Thermoanaerobaculia bacterium]